MVRGATEGTPVPFDPQSSPTQKNPPLNQSGQSSNNRSVAKQPPPISGKVENAASDVELTSEPDAAEKMFLARRMILLEKLDAAGVETEEELEQLEHPEDKESLKRAELQAAIKSQINLDDDDKPEEVTTKKVETEPAKVDDSRPIEAKETKKSGVMKRIGGLFKKDK